MEGMTWLDRQQEGAGDVPSAWAGALLPLVLWAIVLLSAGGASVLAHAPLWAYALVIASPALLLDLVLAGSARRSELERAG